MYVSLSSVSLKTAVKYRKDWDKNNFGVKILQSFMPKRNSPTKGYRLYLESTVGITVPPAVKYAVKQAGYAITDYKAKKCVKIGDKDQKREYAIGRILKDARAKQVFDNDPQLANSTKGDPTKALIVISCHPYDVIAMSTGRKWDKTSCMRLDDGISNVGSHGANASFVAHDVAEGTWVAYATTGDDKNIERPLCRVLIKPFRNSAGDVLWRAESRVYGQEVPGFVAKITKFLRKVNEKAASGNYVLPATLYNDSVAAVSHIQETYTEEEDDTEPVPSSLFTDVPDLSWYNTAERKEKLHSTILNLSVNPSRSGPYLRNLIIRARALGITFTKADVESVRENYIAGRRNPSPSLICAMCPEGAEIAADMLREKGKDVEQFFSDADYAHNGAFLPTGLSDSLISALLAINEVYRNMDLLDSSTAHPTYMSTEALDAIKGNNTAEPNDTYKHLISSIESALFIACSELAFPGCITAESVDSTYLPAMLEPLYNRRFLTKCLKSPTPALEKILSTLSYNAVPALMGHLTTIQNAFPVIDAYPQYFWVYPQATDVMAISPALFANHVFPEHVVIMDMGVERRTNGRLYTGYSGVIALARYAKPVTFADPVLKKLWDLSRYLRGLRTGDENALHKDVPNDVPYLIWAGATRPGYTSRQLEELSFTVEHLVKNAAGTGFLDPLSPALIQKYPGVLEKVDVTAVNIPKLVDKLKGCSSTLVVSTLTKIISLIEPYQGTRFHVDELVYEAQTAAEQIAEDAPGTYDTAYKGLVSAMMAERDKDKKVALTLCDFYDQLDDLFSKDAAHKLYSLFKCPDLEDVASDKTKTLIEDAQTELKAIRSVMAESREDWEQEPEIDV